MDDNKDGALSGEFVLKETAENLPQEELSLKDELEQAAAGIEKNNLHFYSSLCLYPKNVRFENQETDEEIILLVRRALITNLPWIITALFLVLIPLFLFLLSALITPFINISGNTTLVTLLFYYLAIFGFIIIEFTIWYFNVGIVTNKRIIDLDLHGILYKHVAETRLNLIEDVSYKKVGSIRSIFNYGDVFIQTAGARPNFEFMRVPQPAKVVRIVADMIGGKVKWKS